LLIGWLQNGTEQMLLLMLLLLLLSLLLLPLARGRPGGAV